MHDAHSQAPRSGPSENAEAAPDGSADGSILVSRDAYWCSGTPIVIADAGMKIISANPAYMELIGLMPFEVLGTLLKVQPHGPDHADAASEDRQPPLKNGRWQGEVDCQNRRGESVTAFMNLVAVTDERGLVKLHVATLVDISALDREREVLRHQAHHDVLTSLPNRRYFDEELTRSIARARRNGKHLALLFIDLDHFKWINDSLGHGVGDRLLCEVATRLRRAVRTEDLLARIGGDEFALLLEDLSRPLDAAGTAATVLAAIGQEIEITGHRLRVSASIGIAVYPDNAADADGLVQSADQAMYRAKKSGRHGYAFSRKP